MGLARVFEAGAESSLCVLSAPACVREPVPATLPHIGPWTTLQEHSETRPRVRMLALRGGLRNVWVAPKSSNFLTVCVTRLNDLANGGTALHLRMLKMAPCSCLTPQKIFPSRH